MNRTNSIPAVLLASVSCLVLTGVLYLTFVFPQYIAEWADSGEALPAYNVLLITVSDTLRSYALFFFPILILAVIGCLWWAVKACTEPRNPTPS